MFNCIEIIFIKIKLRARDRSIVYICYPKEVKWIIFLIQVGLLLHVDVYTVVKKNTFGNITEINKIVSKKFKIWYFFRYIPSGCSLYEILFADAIFAYSDLLEVTNYIYPLFQKIR